MAAFRRVLVDGADIIETDLHLTADGVFVCIHDGDVDRTTDGHGPVAAMMLGGGQDAQRRLRPAQVRGPRVPALAELCAILPADVVLALELKTDRFLEPDVCRKLADALAAAGVLDRTVVLSFSLAVPSRRWPRPRPTCPRASSRCRGSRRGGWDAQLIGAFGRSTSSIRSTSGRRTRRYRFVRTGAEAHLHCTSEGRCKYYRCLCYGRERSLDPSDRRIRRTLIFRVFRDVSIPPQECFFLI